MNIGDLCQKGTIWVDADESAVEVARRMRDEHVGCVVVGCQREAGVRPLGMITDRDLAMLLVARDIEPELVLANDIMTTPVIVCEDTQQLAEAISLMHEHSVRRLPVVDQDDFLIGIVSFEDIVRELALELAHVSVVGEAAIERESRKLARSA